MLMLGPIRMRLEPAAHGFSPAPWIGVPQPLLDLKGWLGWRFEQTKGEAKPRKVPYYAYGSRRTGVQGSPIDRERLVTFHEARAAAQKLGMTGVGFAPMPEWNIVAVDFDNCIDADGIVHPDVEAALSGTYAEVSPSGKGVRGFVTGDLDNRRSHTNGNDYGLETFASNGFVTVTGNVLPSCSQSGNHDTIAPANQFLLDMYQSRFGRVGTAPCSSEDFMAGYEPRLGLSLDRMKELIAKLDPDMGRDQWIKVGMALHHECQGEDTGFELWDEWSSGGATYPDTEGVRYQWNSFAPRPGKPNVTMATVVKMAEEARSGTSVTAGLFDTAPVKSLSARAIEAKPYPCRDPKHIPPREWIYGYQLLAGTVACLIAPGGSGKSTWLVSTLLSIATGRSLLGKRVWGGAQPVWIWNLEDDENELSRLIEAARWHHGITESDIGERLFVNTGMGGSSLCTAVKDRNGVKLLMPVYEAIAAELLRRGIKVLSIDPFISSHAIEENANSEVDMVVKAWSRVANATGCCIILSHHTNKASGGEVSTNSARGASALTNAARSVLAINRMTAKEAQAMGVADEERQRYVTVADDKHNRAPAEKADWFKIASIDLGNATLERAGDQVGVMTRWNPPTSHSSWTSAQIEKIKQAARDGQYRKSQQAGDWFGHQLAEIMGMNPHTDQRGLNRQIEILIDQGHLKVERRSNSRKGTSPFIVAGSPSLLAHEPAEEVAPLPDPTAVAAGSGE